VTVRRCVVAMVSAAATVLRATHLVRTCQPAYRGKPRSVQGMNDHPRAISDFDRAIAIGFKPDSHRAAAYGVRGISWKAVGEFHRADAEHSPPSREG
jgi:hypothetical protein